jgi:4-carboxymuconolactone decarboxylase
VDYTDRLRLLAINDAGCTQAIAAGSGLGSQQLDPRTTALARLAALIAEGGAVPSYGELVDAEFGEGASAADMVDVLVAAIPIVGLPRAVAEAPKLALALGYDVEEALEQPSGR